MVHPPASAITLNSSSISDFGFRKRALGSFMDLNLAAARLGVVLASDNPSTDAIPITKHFHNQVLLCLLQLHYSL